MSEHKASSDVEKTISLGQQLRKTREMRNLTREEVTKRLNWPKQRVIDIETDNYADLSMVAYTRGYLRAYSRLLDVQEVDVLAAFDNLGIQQTTSKRSFHVHCEKELTSRDRQMRWITYTVAVGLFSFVVLWWHGQKSTSTPIVSRAETQPVTIEQAVQPTDISGNSDQAKASSLQTSTPQSLLNTHVDTHGNQGG